MKILFLAHRTPYPPDKGDKIRSFHLLSELARRHVVSLAYWVDDRKDVEQERVLRDLCHGRVVAMPLDPVRARARALWSLATGRSLSEGFYHSSAMQEKVDSLIREEKPDLVYVYSSSMARYVERQSIPVVIDFVDVDSAKWGQLSEFSRCPMSWLYRLEERRLARFEVRLSSLARTSVFVSEPEVALFRRMGAVGDIVALPNGVEKHLQRLPVWELPSNSSRPIRIVFIGTMNYYPNCDAVDYFAREILPLIRCRHPQAIFEIVGRHPTRSVRRLGRLDGVRVVGEVADIQSCLIQADVSVVPLRIARGVPNKVLEAMAMGIPVVATSEAIKGLHVFDGHELLVGDHPAAFAAQVIRLLSDAELRTKLTKAAWHRLQEEYNWKTIGSWLDALVRGAVENEVGPARSSVISTQS